MDYSPLRLSSVTLRMPEAKRETLKHFYTNILGFQHSQFPDKIGAVDVFSIPQHHPTFPNKSQSHSSIDVRFLSHHLLQPYRPSKSGKPSLRY